VALRATAARLTDWQVFDAVHGRGVVTKLRLEFVSAAQVL
jgi:hypothetical protein